MRCLLSQALYPDHGLAEGAGPLRCGQDAQRVSGAFPANSEYLIIRVQNCGFNVAHPTYSPHNTRMHQPVRTSCSVMLENRNLQNTPSADYLVFLFIAFHRATILCQCSK